MQLRFILMFFALSYHPWEDIHLILFMTQSTYSGAFNELIVVLTACYAL